MISTEGARTGCKNGSLSPLGRKETPGLLCRGPGVFEKRYEENVGLPTTAATAAAAATAITAAAAAALVAAAATTATTITAAAVAATTTAAAITATATATWTGLFRLGSIHAESTTIVVVIVESLNGCVQLSLITEGHESKSLGLPGFTVGDDFDPFNRSKSGEEASNVSFSSSVGQVAHVDIHLIQF